jgi:hypothetical protein
LEAPEEEMKDAMKEVMKEAIEETWDILSILEVCCLGYRDAGHYPYLTCNNAL